MKSQYWYLVYIVQPWIELQELRDSDSSSLVMTCIRRASLSRTLVPTINTSEGSSTRCEEALTLWSIKQLPLEQKLLRVIMSLPHTRHTLRLNGRSRSPPQASPGLLITNAVGMIDSDLHKPDENNEMYSYLLLRTSRLLIGLLTEDNITARTTGTFLQFYRNHTVCKPYCDGTVLAACFDFPVQSQLPTCNSLPTLYGGSLSMESQKQ